MTIQEKNAIFQSLNDSQTAVEVVLDRVTDNTFIHKSAENQWSIAEITEHIILVEKGIIKQLQKLLATPQDQTIPSPFPNKYSLR